MRFTGSVPRYLIRTLKKGNWDISAVHARRSIERRQSRFALLSLDPSYPKFRKFRLGTS